VIERVETSRVMWGVARRWWLLLVLALLGAAAGYGASLIMKPVYSATTTLIVGRPFEASQVSTEEIEASQQLAYTYADVIRRQPVLDGVVRSLNLDTSWQELSNRVAVSQPPLNSQAIVVTTEADSRSEALAIAEEIGDQLIASAPPAPGTKTDAKIQEFVRSRLESLEQDIRQSQERIDELESALTAAETREEAADLRLKIENQARLIIGWQENYSSMLQSIQQGGSTNSLEVLERAEASPEPVRPNIPFNTVLGGGIGLLVALGLAYVLEFRQQDISRQRLRSSARERPLNSGGDHAAPERVSRSR
jgi:capsular polysaccharide biosynthesis protein